MSEKALKNCLQIIMISLFMVIYSSCVFADLGDTVLKEGMNHPDVKELKQQLAELGYLKDSSNSEFDEATKAAVMRFQKDYRLEQDGIIGKDSAKVLDMALVQLKNLSQDFTPMKKDDKGERVTDLQKMLKSYGLLSAEATGTFGDKTEEAVKEFQKEFGLKTTGIVDKFTYAKLKAAAETGLSNRASASRARTNLKVVELAKKYLGTRYVWGASSSKGFDCSGFTKYVLNNFGVDLEHMASRQFNEGIKVDRDKLWPGDLVFFRTGRASVGHVGIYIGNDKFIHASTSKRKVVIDSLSQYSKYSKYIGARRYNLK